MSRQTKGLSIREVRLIGCSFAWVPDPNIKARIENLPADRRGFSMPTKVDSRNDRYDEKSGAVEVVVTADGYVGDVHCWQIVAGYMGVFSVEDGAEVPLQDVLESHGPAQVYAFAREFIADMGRRAKLSHDTIVPPWNFKE